VPVPGRRGSARSEPRHRSMSLLSTVSPLQHSLMHSLMHSSMPPLPAVHRRLPHSSAWPAPHPRTGSTGPNEPWVRMADCGRPPVSGALATAVVRVRTRRRSNEGGSLGKSRRGVAGSYGASTFEERLTWKRITCRTCRPAQGVDAHRTLQDLDPTRGFSPRGRARYVRSGFPVRPPGLSTRRPGWPPCRWRAGAHRV
jgi:hypothetical protein